MKRIEEYHWQGLDPLQVAKLFALALLWVILFVVADHIQVWQGVLMTSAIALFSAAVWREIMTSIRSGCWLTETHFHIYYGNKHWSFPLAGIASIGGRSAPFLMRAPHLELVGGRRVPLPVTSLPSSRHLRRWFAHSAIRVDALAQQA
ncbi:hypothetical protein [Thalassovita taeanensis]|uniref:Uncharacterized protein n=1 Tax=Thalassovita taeanensis TaxID=657014 RepID=A0A1H9FIS6_9RHOB|nr:hypothetical protein [Thalassovita taeanensis]SEQ37797.1 hypothetical protein SAMN04488092_106109 [Thalassovita taeanensis]